ncbi:putative phage tail component, N-terminal domain-containing protein [Terribacillus aidingensis]|uniref:Putative phage tail component, N-terminal domain-containing protein n=1 Tax=Terribacillus aidingensis TaxID=586416 RepID=A0A285NYJ3_9BACI|nr:putative phage tail component, N-terminal domain-containing protein [Terribacillus aidingensis]
MPLNGFEFNNRRSDNIYMLRGRSKSPFSPLEREVVKYSGGHRLKKTTRGLIEINQPVGFKVKNDEEQMQIVKWMTDWLITESWCPLKFDDEPGKVYPAVLQNDMNDFEKMATLRQGTLSFTALYAAGKEIELNLLPDRRSYFITGQRETDWTSKTTFEAPTSKYIIEEAGGGRIVLNYNFIAGDVLTIDYHKRKVLLNGENLATAIALSTVWFPLHPGTMTINATENTIMTYVERFH